MGIWRGISQYGCLCVLSMSKNLHYSMRRGGGIRMDLALYSLLIIHHSISSFVKPKVIISRVSRAISSDLLWLSDTR